MKNFLETYNKYKDIFNEAWSSMSTEDTEEDVEQELNDEINVQSFKDLVKVMIYLTVFKKELFAPERYPRFVMCFLPNFKDEYKIIDEENHKKFSIESVYFEKRYSDLEKQNPISLEIYLVPTLKYENVINNSCRQILPKDKEKIFKVIEILENEYNKPWKELVYSATVDEKVKEAIQKYKILENIE